MARLTDVNANSGITSGVLVTVGDLARVVSKLVSLGIFFLNVYPTNLDGSV